MSHKKNLKRSEIGPSRNLEVAYVRRSGRYYCGLCGAAANSDGHIMLGSVISHQPAPDDKGHINLDTQEVHTGICPEKWGMLMWG